MRSLFLRDDDTTAGKEKNCFDWKKKKNYTLYIYIYIFLFDTSFTFCTCCSVYVGVLTNNYLVFMYLDIDECKGTPYPCIYSNITCLNSPGNFSCLCTKGYDGDGRRNGTGCFHKVDRGNHSALRLSIALGKFPYIYRGHNLWYKNLLIEMVATHF